MKIKFLFILLFLMVGLSGISQWLLTPHSSPIATNGFIARGSSKFAPAYDGKCWWAHTAVFSESFVEGPAGEVDLDFLSVDGVLSSTLHLGPSVCVMDMDADVSGNLLLSGVYKDSLLVDGEVLLMDINQWSSNSNFVLYVNVETGEKFAWNMDQFAEYGFNSHAVAFGPNQEIYCAGSDYNTGWIYRWHWNEVPTLWVSGSELKVFGDLEVNASGTVAFASACFQGPISVGAQTYNAPNSYNAVIGVIDSSGSCTGLQFISDITIQFAEVEWLSNGNLLAAGDWYAGGTIGGFELLGPQWVYSYFLAEMESDGTVIWATTQLHNPNGITGDFELARSKSITAGDSGDFYLYGRQRGDVYWSPSLQTIGAELDLTNEYSGAIIHWVEHEPVVAEMIHGGGWLEVDQVDRLNGQLAVSGTNEYSDSLYTDNLVVAPDGVPFSFLITGQSVLNIEQLQQSLSPFWIGKDIVFENNVGSFQLFNGVGQLMKSGLINQKRISLDQLNLSSGFYILKSQRGSVKFIIQ